jgi:hypothetical protein
MCEDLERHDAADMISNTIVRVRELSMSKLPLLSVQSSVLYPDIFHNLRDSIAAWLISSIGVDPAFPGLPS